MIHNGGICISRRRLEKVKNKGKNTHISIMEGSWKLSRACALTFVLLAKNLFLAAKDVGKY